MMPPEDASHRMTAILIWRDKVYLGAIRPFLKCVDTPVIVTALELTTMQIEQYLGRYPILHISSDVLFHLNNTKSPHLLRSSGGMLKRLNMLDLKLVTAIVERQPNVWNDVLPCFEFAVMT
jgi:hypothetical protein